MSRLAGWVSAWLNSVLDADERFICGSCDDRFPGRAAGMSHVVACHPEFAVTLTSEPFDRWRPATERLQVSQQETPRPFVTV